MRLLRLILILIIGGLLTNLTLKLKYGDYFGESLIWSVLILIGVFVFVQTLLKEIKLYKTENKIKSFSLTFIGLLFIGIILTIDIQIQNDFNKPTLLKVFYNGDYNGIGIDFKTNGTYIFDNSAIGMSNFYYGTYKIEGNKITLDRDKIDNLNNLRNLEIKEKEINSATGTEKELYLFEVDKNGNNIDRATEYRVKVDNRYK
ncbi:hypothetical protein GKZ90_0014700 [Flavobacterium sp. MC2016-06]|jgi:hypothetical protein|uniref:hypothetical protein n=1 Tax=Flavobacterium sp. MC2016-06 TaxID=2676308 RepID=UPI0012BA5AE0|nr:hypothetical protein [Flavobacterium sp. MC2016-06]MBU3859269.1 hypothetical protein [Flavobacterium sp. MC2016-06]